MKFKTGGQFEKPPIGSHLAICYGLIDLGTQIRTFNERTTENREVRILWELPLTLMEGKYNEEHKDKPFSISRKFTMSLHPKSNLYKFVNGWRGRTLTNEEAVAFEPKKLLGLPCRVNLTLEKDEYVVVDSVAALNKADKEQMKKVKRQNKDLFFSLEPDEFDPEVFGSLGEKTQETIKKSPEYRMLFTSPGEEPQPDPGGEEPQVDPSHDDDGPGF